MNLDINTVCADDGFYTNNVKKLLGQEVEIRLQLSRKQKDKLDEISYENMVTKSKLKTAAEMFLYLNSCSNIVKQWLKFYTSIFENESPRMILLTLNRIMKVPYTQKDKHYRNIARILFEKTSEVMALNYNEIQKIVLFQNNKTTQNIALKGMLITIDRVCIDDITLVYV